ncbi:MAG: DEAD/DEAH box helicase, partial [Mycobacterium sp.]|nr:DEAD/DEAH box helicase [Mycobacterium sp.]
ILAPTRELALQIDRTVQPIARSVGLFTTQIYGGVPQARQVGALRKGVDIIIGTPGRIEDLIEQGKLDLSEVRVAVLDEADHMCELGFLEPVQEILRRTAPEGQRLLFSATLDAAVTSLAAEFLREPSVVEVAGEDDSSGTIEHRVLVLDQRDKLAVLAELADGPGRKLVFARTRSFAEQLSEDLTDQGIPAAAIHGDLTQARRERALQRFTDGRVGVLVATDVAARGVHVDDVALVVHVDPPMEHKAYLHRSGRTARAGSDGDVVTVVLPEQRRDTQQLLRRAGISVRPQEVTAESAPVHALVGEIAPLRAAPKVVAPVSKVVASHRDRGVEHRRAGAGRGARGNRRRGTRGAGARGHAQSTS